MFTYEIETFLDKKHIIVYQKILLQENVIHESDFPLVLSDEIIITETVSVLDNDYPDIINPDGTPNMVPKSNSTPPGNTIIPEECINTTHDKAYDYRKSIQEDGTIKYYFIGNFGEYSSRFPDWTEAKDDGNFGTIRRNAIIERVKFDCDFSQPLTSPSQSIPDLSQVSNIINTSDDPNKYKIFGTVIDKKTFEYIKGASITYKKLFTTTGEDGFFTLNLPPPPTSSTEPVLLQECINTTHDTAYDYKKLTYSNGKVDYYFIGRKGTYKQNFPNWTEAPPDTLVGKTSGTVNRDAIVEKVNFPCPPVNFNSTSSIDTTTQPPTSPPTSSSQLRQITGEILISDSDPAGSFNGSIKLVKNELGDITTPPYQTRTDFDGKFNISIPIDGKFLQAKKPGRSTQTLYLPITQESNYVFDFTSITNDGIIQEQVETTVTASLPRLEVSAKDYEVYSLIPLRGDNSIKNDLGLIGLKSLKEDLDEEILKNVFLPNTEVQEVTKPKKKIRWRANQKLIDLLNKLKTVLLPVILTMIAKFGVSKIQELISKGKIKAQDIKNKSCPPKEEIDKIIKRKNKLVKQLNNSLKIINTTLTLIGITRSFINLSLTTSKTLEASSIALPTITPGVTAGSVNVFGKFIKKFNDKATTTKQYVNGLFLVLSSLKIVLTQILTYLDMLDGLIQDCYPEAEQEQISSELLALTQEQAKQESPIVTIVNNFTMGIETEKTPNSLKRRRATATNAGGVVMLKGEWSFSSIDQILIDELVFYIQVNDLKAD